MNKLKILHLMTSYLPRIGGIPCRVDDWCKMTSDVFDNHIFVPDLIKRGKSIEHYKSGVEELDHVTIHRFKQGTPEDISKYIKKYIPSIVNKKYGGVTPAGKTTYISTELIEAIKSFDYDVMIGYGGKIINILPPLIRKDKPFILNGQGEIIFPSAALSRQMHERINAMFMFRDRAVRRQRKMTHYKGKIYCIPQQVNADMFKPITPVEERQQYNLLYVGRLSISKNELPHKLIQSMSKQLPEEFHLTMAGIPDHSHHIATIKNTIKRSNMQNRIHLLGLHRGERLNRLYNKHMFCIRPVGYESYGRFAMECMSAGCTFLGRDHWGYDWADGYYHKLDKSEPNFSKKYINNIRKVVENKELIDGRKLILNQNDWSVVKDKYVEMVKETIANFKGRAK